MDESRLRHNLGGTTTEYYIIQTTRCPFIIDPNYRTQLTV